MPGVHLRLVTPDNEAECLRLRVDDSQARFIATNAKSLAQAKANPLLVPLAIYDREACGYLKPGVPMVGFVMYEVDCGVGSILRIMIDRAHQGKGYGRAAMIQVIRRLQRYPEVEMIVTSHRHDNAVAASLFRSLGFVPWDVREAAELNPGEVHLRLPDSVWIVKERVMDKEIVE
ncbi:MAG: GNAT family N-acetyltransferase [Candidatus Tectomicrobia bacterium]|nr:GNAT family N-acetyltransferase [Candidatus Tectomicrobia bacterium]MBI3026202.1 GNAT family N-acetyltransferase [Candidatus Tectomicrobia bacterium]